LMMLAECWKRDDQEQAEGNRRLYFFHSVGFRNPATRCFFWTRQLCRVIIGLMPLTISRPATV
jgi:hypothetical protein